MHPSPGCLDLKRRGIHMTANHTSQSELPTMLGGLGWEFPFQRELSLGPLIRFWDEATAGDSLRGKLARVIKRQLQSAPELTQPIDDRSVLVRHHDLVEALMTAVFPAVFWDQEHAAALVPFELKSFYATPSFDRDLVGEDSRLRGRLSVDKDAIARFRLLNAYALALHRLHGIVFPVDYPIIFTVADCDTGLDRHFKVNFDGRFIDVAATGRLPAVPPAVRERLEARAGDFEVLASLVPPGSLRVSGVAVL